MSYKIVLAPQAEEDLRKLKRNEPGAFELETSPGNGQGE